MEIFKKIINLINDYYNKYNQYFTPVFIGDAGIGKTSMLISFLKNENLTYYKIDASLLCEEDLDGLPYISDNKVKKSTSEFIEKLFTVDYIIIDEFSRASSNIFKKLMNILLERKFCGNQITAKTICLSNFDDSLLNIIENNAFKTRFVFIDFIDIIRFDNVSVFSYIQKSFTKYNSIVKLFESEIELHSYDINPVLNARTLQFALYVIENETNEVFISIFLKYFLPQQYISRLLFYKKFNKEYVLKNLNDQNYLREFINEAKANPPLLKEFKKDELAKILVKVKEFFSDEIEFLKKISILYNI